MEIEEKIDPQRFAQVKQRLVDDINDYSWDNAEAVISFIQSGIRFSLDETMEASLGQSKFGGQPHLPPTIEWPSIEGQNLHFYFQLNFAEVKPFDENNLLPSSGILYCFLRSEEGLYERPKEYSHFIFLKDVQEDSLEERPYPEQYTPQFEKELPIIFDIYYYLPWTNNNFTLPALDQAYADEQISEDDYDGISDVIDNLVNESQKKRFFRKSYSIEYAETAPIFTTEHLLGDPWSLQDSIQLDWANHYFDLDWEDDEKMEEEGGNFLNLITFQMDGALGFSGLSSPHAYIGIYRDDLSNGNLDKAIFCVQNT